VAREVGSARKLARWRAWYDLEPRGEDRADLHAAVIAHEIVNFAIGLAGGEPIALADMLQAIRDCWIPLTPREKKRRKQRRKQRWKQRLRGYGESLKAAQAVKDKKRGRKPRHDDGRGDA
jgi:hypothetical protein